MAEATRSRSKSARKTKAKRPKSINKDNKDEERSGLFSGKVDRTSVAEDSLREEIEKEKHNKELKQHTSLQAEMKKADSSSQADTSQPEDSTLLAEDQIPPAPPEALGEHTDHVTSPIAPDQTANIPEQTQSVPIMKRESGFRVSRHLEIYPVLPTEYETENADVTDGHEDVQNDVTPDVESTDKILSNIEQQSEKREEKDSRQTDTTSQIYYREDEKDGQQTDTNSQIYDGREEKDDQQTVTNSQIYDRREEKDDQQTDTNSQMYDREEEKDGQQTDKNSQIYDREEEKDGQQTDTNSQIYDREKQKDGQQTDKNSQIYDREEEKDGQQTNTSQIYYTEIDSPESEDLSTYDFERKIDGAVSDLQSELRMAESMTETEAVVDLQSELLMAESMHEELNEGGRVVEGSEASSITILPSAPKMPERSRYIDGAEMDKPVIRRNELYEDKSESKRKSRSLSRQVDMMSGELCESMTPTVIRQRLYPDFQDIQSDTDVRPLTDEQLKSLYYNSELESLDDFVEDFLKTAKCDRCEFYELVLNYYRARNHLVTAEQDVLTLQADCDKHLNLVWSTSQSSVLVTGKCADQYKVTKAHMFDITGYSEQSHNDLSRTLKTLRNFVHEELSLYAYSAQLSRLQVESYMHEMLKDCPALKDIPHNAPVSAYLPGQRDSNITHQVEALKTCIKVLFTFQRKPTNDSVFVKDTRKWLRKMVAVLLRVSTLEDHLFLINQLLRCPPGVGQWAASFIQIRVPPVPTTAATWDSPLLDHCVAMLATLLMPVKGRDQLLYQLKGITTQSENSMTSSSHWILVDSDGEEDDDTSTGCQLLAENDLVAMLEQFPINDIFRCVLLINSENGGEFYDISRYSESGIVKLFAFATLLIKIIGAGLDNFSLARYRQLNKRLARMIVQLLDYVSDHWEMFQVAYKQDISQDTMYRLQLEYDNVFCRAVKTVLGAQRLGSWQYLADLPYRSVSNQMIWRLLWLMHHGYKHTDISISIPIDQCRQILEDPDCREYFEGKLITMPTSEAIYLLTTFANMAKSRPGDEQEFVVAIATEVYEIAYISNHTREFCFKVGRDLLASICVEHTPIISLLIHKVEHTLDQVGMVALGLFQELKLDAWLPALEDIDILRSWLLDHNMDSAANQLARLIITKMNWSTTSQNNSLFLDVNLHRQMAVLLVQTYMKHLTNKNVVGYFTVGMKQVVSAVWNQLSSEQQLSNWTWDMALRLCLNSQSWAHEGIVNSHAFQHFYNSIPNINEEATFFPIVKGLNENCGLASYLALVMSKYSHGIDDFCSEGLLLFSQLIDQHYYVPALRALSYISVLFHDNPDHLDSNSKFLQSLQQLIYSDQHQKTMAMLSWDFPGPCTRLFANMAQNQLQKAKASGRCGVVIHFWLRLLTRMSQWNHDRNVLFILDNLIRAAFRIAEAHQAVNEFFKQLTLNIVRSPGQQQQGGVLSSIVSWIASGKNQHSLIETQSCAEFSWYAYTVLLAECEVEEEIGLWGAMCQELQSGMSVTVDQALKNSQTQLKLELPAAIHRLSVYRWIYQAVDMELDHPLLPLVWQNFFLRYLGRPPPEAGLSERGSVGEKFFENTANVSLMKRMKKKLAEATEFHHSAMTEMAKQETDLYANCNSSDERSGDEDRQVLMANEDIASKKEFHCKMIKFYNTIKNWLDEPRLHDAKLYLPALPVQYEADRLLSVFQNEKTPWLEFMNMSSVDKQVAELSTEWDQHCNIATTSDEKRPSRSSPAFMPANKRILERLKNADKPKSPPSMTAFKAPVPEVNAAFLCDTQSLFYALRSDYVSLTDYAKLFSMRVSKHVGLDIDFLELLPNLYKNEMQEVVVTIPCQSMVNPLHKCKGAASVTIRYEAKTKNEVTGRRVDENRAEYKQLMIESLLPPAQNLCSSAVHVENAITALIRMVHMSASDITKAAAIEAGTSLFYHMASLVTEDIRNYPPTCQFFAACIEILGQEFVLNNSLQSQPLLQAILVSPSLVGLLAPNFSPNASPDLFVTMYENMINVPTNQGCDIAFTLLSKFDVRKWLDQASPSMSERSALVEVIGNALCVCGPDPESKFLVVFEVYRRHLQHLLRHKFPDHYADVLKLILKGSASGSCSVELWDDFLASISCPRNKEPNKVEETSSLSSFASNTEVPKYQVSVTHMRETMDWLSSYFFRLRVCRDESARFGLYPKWRPYLPGLTSFLGYLTQNTVRQLVAVCNAGDLSHQQVMHELWMQITELFAPWVRPLDNSCQILTPWIQADHALASDMVATYADSLRELHAQFEGTVHGNEQSVLAMLWPYYVNTLARPGTPEHVLTVFHTQLLSLPWSHFHPDTPALYLMLQLQEKHHKSCFMFLANIFVNMNWLEVMHHCGNHDTLVQLHICLFHLMVKMALEDDILQETNLGQLMLTAESFNWSYLDSLSYNTTIKQFMDSCEPTWVLKDRTSKENRVLSLLKCASGFGQQDWVTNQPETPVKRCAYVRCVVTLLCRVSHLPNIDPSAMDYFLNNLLTEIEAVINQVSENTAQYQEAVSQCSELLCLLNNCDKKNTTLVTTLVDWVISSPTSILLQPLLTAACRTLNSHDHLALVIEACIDAHFSAVEEPAGDIEGWGWVLSAVIIPDSKQKEFLRACVEHGSYLTLFTYTLQRLPLCQSLNDEMPHLNNLISWTTMVKPCRENEGKLMLWWAKVVELIIRHLHFGGNPQFIVRWLNTFVPALFGLAEDKSSQGLLGAIGLGRRSQLSHRFRLFTRGLGTFLLAQMPSNNEVRADPHAPGSIRGQSAKDVKPTPAANAALSQLESLRNNKHYASFKQHVEYTVDFTSNPEHCIRDTPALILFLVRELYSEKPYLGILLTSTPSRVTSPTTGVQPPMPQAPSAPSIPPEPPHSS